MATYKRKTGDTRMIRTVLKSAGQPVDVAGAAIEVRMRPDLLGQGPVVAAPGTVLQTASASSPPIGAKGQVGYTPPADDVAVSGTYRVEWHVAFPDGQHAVFPSDGYDDLVLDPAL